MRIAVIGLGLIGGSLCKAFQKYTQHTVLGLDTDEATMDAALAEGAVDERLTPDRLDEADVSFICLYPEATVHFIQKHAAEFKKGSMVCDVCGIKSAVALAADEAFSGTGVHFVPCHPMAGREVSGFSGAQAQLWQNASFIITPTDKTCPEAVKAAGELELSIGFGQVVTATPQEHDRVIAYTSQLAHVVSSAYVKSPSIENECGFSAGSFQDMTRIATINEEMWSSLFLLNRDPLLFEVKNLIGHLQQYEQALEQGDRERLIALLADGSRIKRENLKKEAAKK